MTKSILIIIFITLFGTAIFAQNDSGCPILHITGPPGVTKLGETATFSASLSGDYDEQKIRFNWSVDQGEIIEGQGTTVITVSTAGLEDSTITATVEISGLPEKCGLLSASETGIPDCGMPIESLSSIADETDEEIKVIIDSYIVRLKNNPNSTLFLLSYGSGKEIEKRENKIKSLLKNCSINLNMIVFLSKEENEKIRTEAYLAPPGATPPTP